MDDQGFEQVAAGLEASKRSEQKGIIKATDGVIPLFRWEDVEDKRASEEAGRVIMKQVAYIEIIVPGSRDRPIGPVNELHKKRFHEQWESFLAGDSGDRIVGTPITEWQGVSRTRAHELKANGFYTVELVAQCADDKLKKLGNQPSALRHAAQQYIGGIDALALQRAENQKLMDQIAELTAAVAELKSGNDQRTPAGGRRSRRDRDPI